MYIKEQAEKDKAEFEKKAEEAMARGDYLTAGIYSVEAYNCLERIGMKKEHKPSLGPYSPNNPSFCVHCGMLSKQWSDEECVPKKIDVIRN